MAANKTGTTGGAGEAGGTALAIPEGFTTGKNKFYAEGVARRFDTMPPEGMNGGGAVKLLLVANQGTTEETVRGLLGSPRFQLRMMAPGIFTAWVKAKDMDTTIGPNVGMDKMFRFVDLGHRMLGTAVTGANDTATVAVAYEGSMGDAKKKLKSLGMTIAEAKMPAGELPEEWVNPDEGLVVGTMTGGKLYDLALHTKATSIEIRDVATPGGKA
jgi:hypothetical protein